MLRILLSLMLATSLFACGDDDGPTDAGSDAGTVDTGTTDSGGDDAGESDAGEDDAGGDDAGADDAGEDDAGEADAAADAAETDAGEADAGRTIFEGACARTFGTCDDDSDCMPSGCGSETCSSEEIVSTCDCTMPAATCGCIDGSCAWFN